MANAIVFEQNLEEVGSRWTNRVGSQQFRQRFLLVLAWNRRAVERLQDIRDGDKNIPVEFQVFAYRVCFFCISGNVRQGLGLTVKDC